MAVFRVTEGGKLERISKEEADFEDNLVFKEDD
jgi:hypothetical protein